MITYDRLREVLSYNEDTGLFTWISKASSHVKVGSTAGRVTSGGYVIIRIDNLPYSAHRLAWLYMNKESPPFSIDHINRVRNDNRKVNLRLATKTQNAQNRSLAQANTSGVKGVHWAADRRRWAAKIVLKGKVVHLGYARIFEDAVAMRKEGEAKYNFFSMAK
jgi:hypothetical protein